MAGIALRGNAIYSSRNYSAHFDNRYVTLHAHVSKERNETCAT